MLADEKPLVAVNRAEITSTLKRSLDEAKRGEGRSARIILKEIAATVGVKLKDCD